MILADLARTDMAKCVEDAFRYSHLVLATLTYNADVFPCMKTFINQLTERSYQNRTVGFMENGTWAPTAKKVMQTMLEKSKNLTYLENNVTIRSAVHEDTAAVIEAMAEEICNQ